MADAVTRSRRRTDALSRERIVSAGIDLLDLGGDGALTVRALSTRLATGRGAIYHHVASLEDLLAGATDHVIAEALERLPNNVEPEMAIRALATTLFDVIDERSWVGTQLSREPLQPAVFRIWKSIGIQLRQLGVAPAHRADAGAALTNYVLGSAAQYAAGARTAADPAARQRYLDDLAAAWVEQDSDDLVHDAAAELRAHDDRDQFLRGVDIFLAGIRRDHSSDGRPH